MDTISVITKPEYIDSQIKKFNINEVHINNLKQKYMDLKIEGVSDKPGYTAVRSARLEIGSDRRKIEATRKELTQDLTKFKKAIDGEASRLTALLEPMEKHLKSMEDAYEEEKERIKKEKEAQEQLRLQSRINQILQLDYFFDGIKYVNNWKEVDLGIAFGHQISAIELKSMPDDEFLRVTALITESHCIYKERLAEIEQQKQKAVAQAEQERVAQEALLKKIQEEQAEERRKLDAIVDDQKKKEDALRAEQEKFQAEKRELEEKQAHITEQEVLRTHAVEMLKQDMAQQKAGESVAQIIEEQRNTNFSDKQRNEFIKSDTQKLLSAISKLDVFMSELLNTGNIKLQSIEATLSAQTFRNEFHVLLRNITRVVNSLAKPDK